MLIVLMRPSLFEVPCVLRGRVLFAFIVLLVNAAPLFASDRPKVKISGNKLPLLSLFPRPEPESPLIAKGFQLPQIEPGTYRGYGESWSVSKDQNLIELDDDGAGLYEVEVKEVGVLFRGKLYPWATKWYHAGAILENEERWDFFVRGRCGRVWILLFMRMEEGDTVSRLVRMCVAGD